MMAWNMSYNLTKQIMSFDASEQKLKEIEQSLLDCQDWRNINPLHIKEKSFIPDHLGFGCDEGIYIIQISVPKINSFVVKRD